MLRHMGGDGTAASRARPSGWQGAPIAPEQHSIASSLFLVLQLAAPSAMLLQRLLASAGAASLRSGFAGGASQLIRSAPRTLPSLQQRRELTCSPVCMGRQASGPHRVLPHVLVIPGSSMYACAAVDATAAGRSLPPLPAAAATAAARHPPTLCSVGNMLRPAGAAPRLPLARARLMRRRPSCTVRQPA